MAAPALQRRARGFLLLSAHHVAGLEQRGGGDPGRLALPVAVRDHRPKAWAGLQLPGASSVPWSYFALRFTLKAAKAIQGY